MEKSRLGLLQTEAIATLSDEELAMFEHTKSSKKAMFFIARRLKFLFLKVDRLSFRFLKTAKNLSSTT